MSIDKSSTAKKIKGLYAISNHDELSRGKLIADTLALLKGGATIFQFRDKLSNAQEKQARALVLKTLCAQYQCSFIINDDVNLALEIDADGAHLGQQDVSLLEARKRLGAKKIIGQSCHNSLDLALRAHQQGADYIALGRFFPSKTKTYAPQADIGIISQVKRQCRIPVVAIGGITLDNAPSLLAAGADALAVIDDLLTARNIEQHARSYQSLFKGFPRTNS
jgi:thiamine-phosphate pyrophosphorylase